MPKSSGQNHRLMWATEEQFESKLQHYANAGDVSTVRRHSGALLGIPFAGSLGVATKKIFFIVPK